jgi:hypothetical protein
MDMPAMYAGMQVYESLQATKARDIPRIKSWVQKVLEWNPCNPWALPDTITLHEPTSYVFQGRLIAHPEIIAALRKQSWTNEPG